MPRRECLLTKLRALVFHQGDKRVTTKQVLRGQPRATENTSFSSAGGQQGHDMIPLGQIEYRADLVGTQV